MMNAEVDMEVVRKTERARVALAPGARLLSPRERALVLLADGQRSVPDLCAMLQGTTSEFVRALVSKGFLEIVDDSAEKTARRVSGDERRRREPEAANEPVAPLQATVEPEPTTAPDRVLASEPSAPEQTVPMAGLARPATLRRSNAATKMHLMDLAERTFARSQPKRAIYFREMLREIRDDESLLLAIDIVLEAVAEVAGADRAQAMREHLLETPSLG